jgi:hypothetical protein
MYCTGLGDAQANADTQAAQAQHQAALDAIAARNAGDMAAYSAAIQRLYDLGIVNAASAMTQDLQTIADTANVGNLFGSVGSLAKWVALGIGGLLLLTYLPRPHRKAA